MLHNIHTQNHKVFCGRYKQERGAAHLEGLSLSLATPDTQDEGDLDFGQVHEVLGHMDGHLVQEGGRDVVAVLNVVEGGAGLADVVLGRQDGVVGAHGPAEALEQIVGHAASALDVLLRGWNCVRCGRNLVRASFEQGMSTYASPACWLVRALIPHLPADEKPTNTGPSHTLAPGRQTCPGRHPWPSIGLPAWGLPRQPPARKSDTRAREISLPGEEKQRAPSFSFCRTRKRCCHTHIAAITATRLAGGTG